MEDDSQVSVSELRTLHFNQWTEADLRRMEKWVLRQLNWRVPLSTYLPFLQLFSEIVSRSASGHSLAVGYLMKKAEACLMEEPCIVLKPSSLALGVLQHCLQTSSHCSIAVTTTILALQNILQVCDSELYECSCILNQRETLTNSNRSQSLKPSFPLKLRYRPAWEGSSELQTISEELDTSGEEINTNGNISKESEASPELDNRFSCKFSQCKLESRDSTKKYGLKNEFQTGSRININYADECESDMSDSTNDSDANESGDAMSDSSYEVSV